MSGIGELAYMLLLGWMRGLVDWFWRVVSGGAGGGLQWFLSNWKPWLVIILAGGLLVDWIMWLIRWRPYRVFFSRFRASSKSAPPVLEDWDAGVGYYEHETMLDTEPSDWGDMTLSTLSEFDPNWAEGVFIDVEDTPDVLPESPEAGQHSKTYFYSDAYEEPQEAYQNAENDTGYWENDPADEPAESQWQALPYEEDAEQWEEPAAIVPYADDEEEPAAYADEAEVEYYDDDDDPRAEKWVDLPKGSPLDAQPQEQAHFGRSTMWPGAFPNIEKTGASSPKTLEADYSQSDYSDESSANDYENDPLFSTADKAEAPQRQSRMLRRLRKSDEDSTRRRSRQSKKEERQLPDLQKTRPQRLVQAMPTTSDPNTSGVFRTVTGKPVKRQGLLRLAATDDDPIAGLPPMQIDNAFYPKAMPNDPDFSDDDGNY